MSEKFTPTEDLMLELLIARTRLGHYWWTLASSAASKKAANSLEARGYIGLMHGVVEKTFRAYLTDKAKNEFMKTKYVPPILGGPK